MELRDTKVKDFTFCHSSQLNKNFIIKILYLSNPPKSISIDTENLSISIQPFSNNKPLTIPTKTPYKYLSAGNNWNELLKIPLNYSNLPIDSQLAITIWYISAKRQVLPLAGTTFKIFGKHNTLKKGKYKLKLWKFVEGDGSINSKTPSKILETSEIHRLEKIARKYDRGDIPRIDWMDLLVTEEMDRLNKENSNPLDFNLHIEMPVFDFPLVYNEKKYDVPFSDMGKCSENLIKICDLDMFRDNPVENKHRKLARSNRTGPMDRDIKPNSKIRDDLNKILRYSPSKQLTIEEKNLVWKFRFYLTKDKKALTKFLKSVTWEDLAEVKQAVELLPLWVEIDLEDVLELLGPTFPNAHVQQHAVEQLTRSGDEEISLYLLQLVQALKFGYITTDINLFLSPLAEFLISRSLHNPLFGNRFYWFLKVECEDKQYGKLYTKVINDFTSALGQMFDGENRLDIIKRQVKLMSELSNLSREFRSSKETRPKKIEKLQSFIADPKNGLLSFSPLPLPLDAKVQVIGIVPEKAYIFKSALFPLRLTFNCLDGSQYELIFKTGDDLRQDQLVIQIISLMDLLLRKENLDLRLTPYKVLATGTDEGIVQFITSDPIASILARNNNSITSYLLNNIKKDSNSIQISTNVMDTYIRSMAGYCVITYLLGIGDRHLDNILLTESGNLFHIDFGYILGRDPKPFPPPMKICKEMVEAMGGTSAPQYQKFRSYCFVAFTSLRKSANLILNLFALMVGTNMQDLALEPDKVVSRIQDRFRLDLNDEEAIQFMSNILNESISAFFPQVMEQLHKVVQLWRS